MSKLFDFLRHGNLKNKLKDDWQECILLFKTHVWTKKTGKNVGAIMLAGLVVTIMALYIGQVGYAPKLFMSYFLNPLTFLFNYLPVTLFIAIFTFLFQSLRISVVINGLFWAMLGVANVAKISYRFAALKPEDFALIPTTLKIIPHYIQDLKLASVLPFGLVLVGLIVFARFLPKMRFTWHTRLLAALSLLIICGLSVTTLYANTDLYKAQYGINEARWCDSTGITYRLHSDRFQANGLMYSFLYHSSGYLSPSDENYNEEIAKNLVAQYGNQPIAEGKKVHVITILLESFMDYSTENKGASLAIPGGDPYAPLHQLQANSLSGEMISDVYGGGTIHIETSVLSGLYRQPNYINHSGYTNAHYLMNNGYYTLAMHPNDGYFYSRYDRFPNEGFNNFLYTQNYFHNDLNAFYPDRELFPKIKEQLDVRKANGPVFLYAATMQGHGPYNCDSLEGREWFPYDGISNKRAYYMLNNYFESVWDTGNELLKFQASLEEEDEPVVVVYFGDHSPRMEEGGYDILGLNTENEAADSVRSKLINYATPYGMWANDAAKSVIGKDFHGELPTIDPNQMLSNVAFGYLGWHGDAFQAFSQDYGKEITTNKNDFWCVNGVNTRTYPEQLWGRIEEMKHLSIYYRKQKTPPAIQLDERAQVEKSKKHNKNKADASSSSY